jgi:hypothetical protein
LSGGRSPAFDATRRERDPRRIKRFDLLIRIELHEK